MHMDMLIDHSNNKISLGGWPNVGVFLCHSMLSQKCLSYSAVTDSNSMVSNFNDSIFLKWLFQNCKSNVDHFMKTLVELFNFKETDILNR